MITYLILIAISGLVVGGLARLALPGPDPMSIWMTMGVGIAGSLVGGLIVAALSGGRANGGFLAGFACSVFFVWLIRRRRGQTLWSTRREPGQTRF